MISARLLYLLTLLHHEIDLVISSSSQSSAIIDLDHVNI